MIEISELNWRQVPMSHGSSISQQVFPQYASLAKAAYKSSTSVKMQNLSYKESQLSKIDY
jgi:hypothetical protein